MSKETKNQIRTRILTQYVEGRTQNVMDISFVFGVRLSHFNYPNIVQEMLQWSESHNYYWLEDEEQVELKKDLSLII